MDVTQAVRAVCLSFPEAEEKPSHGSPEFRVRGKSFASYVVNHHGDGRIALWLNVPPGAQQAYCEADPKHFFVPPYVGPRGWLGVRLERLTLFFWVGTGGQAMVTLDPRFHVPPYTGHNGWIALDVTKDCDWAEVRALVLTSYQHFALKRMLRALDAGSERRR